MSSSAEHKENAVISVFLALSMVLILSMILAMLESARIRGAEGYLAIVSGNALKSAFSEYYRPLFDEYHVLGLDTGYGTAERNTERVSVDVSEWTEACLSGFYSGEITGCETENCVYLTDENGDVFGRQAMAYEKYAVSDREIEKILEKLNLLADRSKQIRVIRQEMELVEQLSGMDEGILNLMTQIDGVSFKNGALIVDKDGKPMISDGFVKLFCPKETTSEELCINNSIILNSVAEMIHTYPARFFTWKTYGEGYYLAIDRIEDLKNQQKSTVEDINAITERIEELLSAGEKPEESMKIAALEINLESAVSELDKLSGMIAAETENLEVFRASAISLHDELLYAADTAKKSIESALQIIDDLEKLQTELSPLVEEFEKVLEASEPYLDEDFFLEAVSELEEMKKYVGVGTEGKTEGTGFSFCDIDSMKKTLAKDSEILEGILSGFPEAIPGSNLSEWVLSVDGRGHATESYSLEGLAFDYSEIRVNTENAGGFLSTVRSVLNKGVTDLLLPENADISEKSIDSGQLVSNLLQNVSEGDNHDYDYKPNSSITDAVPIIPSQILGNKDIYDIESIAIDSARRMIEKALLCEYGMDHFTSFQDEATGNHNALEYELEYLIGSDNSDSSNLDTAIKRILLIRMAFSFAYVVTDKETRTKAETAAISSVGFTGMTFLVQAMKYLILSVWAVYQAMAETSAVVSGRSVPLLTSAESFCVELNDIAGFSKENIREKAAEIKGEKGLWGYRDYMRLFLFLEKKNLQELRMLDLIQENLRRCYEDTFRVRSCMTECGTKVTMRMTPLFFKGFRSNDNSGNSGHYVTCNSWFCY